MNNFMNSYHVVTAQQCLGSSCAMIPNTCIVLWDTLATFFSFQWQWFNLHWSRGYSKPQLLQLLQLQCDTDYPHTYNILISQFPVELRQSYNDQYTWSRWMLIQLQTHQSGNWSVWGGGEVSKEWGQNPTFQLGEIPNLVCCTAAGRKKAVVKCHWRNM